jgi:uncharacterized membrane protein (DUF4010 family)
VIETVQPFAIALAIGLLIGTERERAHPPGAQAFGVRSFALLALLGALTAWVGEPLVAGGLALFAIAAVLLGYLRSTRDSAAPRDIGLTTELAAVLTFGLGYAARRAPLLALALGGVVLALLLARDRLHRFSRTELRPEELEAAATLLVLALGLLPLLPDRFVDPWEIVNPRRFGVLVVLVAGIQFAGYVAARVAGPERGLLFAGFFSGFASSTAASATFPRVASEAPALARPAAGAVLLATVAMQVSLGVVLAAASPALGVAVTPMLAAASAVGCAGAWLAGRGARADAVPAGGASLLRNPLSLGMAFRLALALAVLLVVVGLARRSFGAAGVEIVALLGGFAEMHGVALGVALLHAEGSLATAEASEAVALALGASFVTKLALTLWLGRGRYAGWLVPGLLAMVVAGAAALLLLPLPS